MQEAIIAKRQAKPALTTFRQARRGVGQRGAALLRAMLVEHIPRLVATLLVRDSTSPALKENPA